MSILLNLVEFIQDIYKRKKELNNIEVEFKKKTSDEIVGSRSRCESTE